MGIVGFFRRFSREIIQIVLVLILLPFVAILLGSFPGALSSGPQGFFFSLIDQIPLCEGWINAFYQVSGGLTTEDVISSTLPIILKAFPEAMILAISVHFCIQASKKLGVKGIPIFASFIGVVIASIITSLTGLTKNLPSEIILDLGAVIVMIIGLKMLTNTFFGGTSILSTKRILAFVFDSLFAVLTTAYISGLILAANGAYGSVNRAVETLLLLAALLIAAGFLAGWVINQSKNDPDLL